MTRDWVLAIACLSLGIGVLAGAVVAWFVNRRARIAWEQQAAALRRLGERLR